MKKNNNKMDTNELPHEHDESLPSPMNTAPLDMMEGLMPMEKESRKDYIYMMKEEEDAIGMDKFEEFGGEVPIMYATEEEEDMGLDQGGLYYTEEQFDNNMMVDTMVKEWEDMGMGDSYGGIGEEEAPLGEGVVYYTQEDIDRMFENEVMEEMDGYYEEIEEPFIDEMDMGGIATGREEEAQFGQGNYNYLTQEDIDRMVEMGEMDGYFE